ncbi:MAG: ATP-binding protein [Clostridiales Family XIII bacterium]|jgi:hypothetical protein|nr:ATP-binding protein [Clostridiales Family XIII bacterium]
MKIIGREHEQAEFDRYMGSGKPEFLAVYGRRRVGKTFLIKEYFHGEFAFYATGVANAGKREQLENFHAALNLHGGEDGRAPRDWRTAFLRLRKLLEADRRPGKKVVFLDEMPWMDTQKSGFVSALELFWNGWADARPDILLIVCGSASAWMLNKLIRSHGGLHGRVTQTMRIEPFSLRECRAYFRAEGMAISDYQVLEYYMALGGVPYYLSLVNPALSFAQNIDALCFAKGARLRGEFREIYASLFKGEGRHEGIVRAIALKAKGLTRGEIAAAAKIADGGHLTKALDELEVSGFIRKYRPYGKKARGQLYQLTDFYSNFYLRFIEDSGEDETDYWAKQQNTPAHAAWTGYAFEQVCLAHIAQIKQGLGISGILAPVSSWRSERADPGAQVDLVIDRSDGVVDLCEMKYAPGEFVIDKSYDLRLRNRITAFAAECPKRKAVRIVMVTTFGLRQNEYSSGYPARVTMGDLFA